MSESLPSVSTASPSILDALDILRQDEILCDCVLLSFDGERFPVHRPVMAACSSFFRGLFVHRKRYFSGMDKTISSAMDKTISEISANFSEKSDESKRDNSDEGGGEFNLEVSKVRNVLLYLC